MAQLDCRWRHGGHSDGWVVVGVDVMAGVKPDFRVLVNRGRGGPPPVVASLMWLRQFPPANTLLNDTKTWNDENVVGMC